MKMNLFTKHCAAAIFFTAAVSLASCSDQDFDFEKMRSQNFLANYEQRFASLFGAIDPDQNWDFSDVELPSTKTRAGDDDEIVPITSMNDAISQDELDKRWTDSWYYVQPATLDKIKEYLPEHGGNVDKEINGRRIGESFTLEVPDCGFKITPIFQGANSWHPTSYMTVTYTDEDNVTTSKTYRLWGEGEHIQCIYDTQTCTTCNGTGLVTDMTSEAIGVLVGVYTIKNAYSYTTTGWGRQTYNYYLNNKGAGTSSTKFAVIKDKSNNLHLYSLAAKAYLVANTDNGDLVATANINEASVLTYTSGGPLKLGEQYLYVNNGSNNRGQLRKTTTSSTNTNYQWTWTSATTNETENNLISEVLHAKDCPNCHGTGSTGTWKSPGTSTEGTTVDQTWVALDNIRGNSLVFKPNDLPVGATIVFKTVVTEVEGAKPQTEPTNVTNGYYKYTSGTKTNYFYSTASTGDPYILKLDIPKPSNITATTIVDDVAVPHEVMVIACEGGNNSDMNEILYIIEGDPYLPRVRDTKEWRITESKRYMVEDMGYSDINSAAVAYGYTDIDFNDIVVDFTKERKYKRNFNGSTPTGTDEPLNEYRQRAIIRALGGTWDFILKVDGEPVFQKSKSENTAQNITLDRQNKTLPPVVFNTNYIMYGGTSSGTPLSEQGPLNYGIMYNTSRGGIDNVDGHFEQDLRSNQSYICTIVSEGENTNAIRNWDPETNNIEFVIYDSGTSDKHYDSKNEVTNGDKDPQYDGEKNVYNFGFPSAGATPKIVAFPNTIVEGQITNVKEWKGEKVHVDKNWFPRRSN